MTVGVPESRPLLLNASPFGRVPAEIAQLYVPFPPVATNCKEGIAVPLVAAGMLAGEVTESGA